MAFSRFQLLNIELDVWGMLETVSISIGKLTALNERCTCRSTILIEIDLQGAFAIVIRDMIYSFV